MQKILQGLNFTQKAAVTSTASVLQVLAPPGSGKTKTLTSRVAYLLAHEQYAPWNVICCTFTIKSSREMRERLRGMIGEELESKLILGTFHSVCRRYLVTYGHLIGVPKNFGVADSDDSLNIVKRAVKRLRLTMDPRIARSRISHRKARGKRLEDIPKISKTLEAQEFSTIFQEYEDALALSNLLDYDDLLTRCVQLLKEHPECVSNIEALLIDEFQDTNVVQFELIKLLASARRRVTIVGDPDQSIYGFRSAEIENLKRMKVFYPETVVINLEENYRSTSAVLKLAQEVIEQDTDRPQKKLKSTHRYGTLPVLRKLPNPHEEAQWIVSEIKRVTAMTGGLIQHRDVAVLLRSAFLSLLIEKALANAGLPYRMVGGRRFFDRVEVRILLDYLRAIAHPANTAALLAIINTPSRKIGDTTMKELLKVAEVKKESLWSISQKVLTGQLALEKKLAKPAEQGLSNLVSLITRARQKMNSMKPDETPGKLLELIQHQLDYRNYLKKQYPEDHQERWENVQELLAQASDASLHLNVLDDDLPTIDGVVQEKLTGPQEHLSRFLTNVSLSTEVESNENGEQQSRITISTIHSAKGLEWPVVFVPAVYEGSIPHSRSEDTDEERRLLYVAMTRAQALLYMTFPVMQSRDQSESILSQFLPDKITPLVSQTGPVLNDYVIGDIASVLRRPVPSQEAIAQGHLGLKANESQNDDIWPVDGSHRRSVGSSESEPVSFVLQKGQSLSDALRATSAYNQRSNYSFLANSNQISNCVPTTMNLSSINIPTTFTTASHHMRNAPQPNKAESFKPTLTKSASEGSDRLPKKAKFDTSISGQGSITTFFDSGNTANKNSATIVQPHEGIASETIRAHYPLQAISANSQSSIPPALSSHKLSCGSLFVHKKPRLALGNSGKKDHNSGDKRDYSFLSSPTEDNNDRSDVNKSSNTAAAGGYKAPQTSMVTTSFKAPTTGSDVSISNTRCASSGSILSAQQNSFRSSQLNRLGTLSPLDNMQGAIHRQGTNQPRRTLGIRRSMSGWDNRKNK